jgi:hypothetical protein
MSYQASNQDRLPCLYPDTGKVTGGIQLGSTMRLPFEA